MIDTVRPSIRRSSPSPEAEPVSHASAMPIIVNAAAALQVLAEFFEVHMQLSKEEVGCLPPQKSGALDLGYGLCSLAMGSGL